MTEIIRITEAQAITEATSRATSNAAAVYLASLPSESGRRTMRGALDKIARMMTAEQMDIETFPYAHLRYEHVAAIRAKLSETLAPATVNKYLAALRGTLKAAWLLGQMDAETYHRAVNEKGIKNETLPAGRGLSAGELAAMMRVCANDPRPAGARDAALVAVLYGALLRRAEAVALDLSDYDAEKSEIRITGKGRKDRENPLPLGATEALADWLTIRGPQPGPLFWAITKSGKLIPGRLTTHAIYKMLARRAEQASVKAFSPHDLRRSSISDLLDAGNDLAIVQRLAGHAAMSTTGRYDRRPQAAKAKAIATLHVPYHRRGL